MPVSLVYRGQGGVNASFDWLDLTSGAGYKRFYAAGAQLSGSNAYFLTSKVIDSSTKAFSLINDGNGSFLTKDFDITFSVPATIGGADAFVNVLFYSTGTGAGVDAILKKVSGSNVTVIGTANGVYHDQGASAYHRELLKIAVTQTTLAIGDKLRLTIQTNSTNTVKFYFDPSSSLTFGDENSRTVGTDLTLDCPFKIDL